MFANYSWKLQKYIYHILKGVEKVFQRMKDQENDRIYNILIIVQKNSRSRILSFF